MTYIKIPVMNDELLYSWLYRMARANCFDTLNEYLSCFSPTSHQFRVSQYDIKAIGETAELMNFSDSVEFMEIYRKSSLYSFYSLFMTRMQQLSYLNMAMRSYRKDSSLIINQNISFIDELRICPECRKEELAEYGYFIYHRSHQLPGVRACTKHRCTLHRYTGKSGREFHADSPSEEIPLKADISTELRYSEFTRRLADSNLDLSAEDIASIISDRLKSRNQDRISDAELSEELMDKGSLLLYSGRRYSDFIKKSLTSSGQEFEIDMTVILMNLFSDPACIPTPSYDDKEITSFTDFIRSRNYLPVSEYRRNLVILRHDDCGSEFLTTPYGFLKGFRCPSCDREKTDDEIIRKIVWYAERPGEYELTDRFTGWDKPVKIRHNRCGSIMNTRLRRFIIEEQRCKCTNRYTSETVSRQIETLECYDLLAFDGVKRKMKVRNKLCGHEFEIDYYKFSNNTQCRICYPTFIDTADKFVSEIAKITTDEYKLIGDYSPAKNAQKIELLHTQCGRTFRIHAWYFLNGHRCPYCYSEMSISETEKLIDYYSCGRYRYLPEESKNTTYITISDRKSGKKITMYKNLAIQELTRPTPSKKLPTDERPLKNRIFGSHKTRILHHLKKTYYRDEPIFTEDITVDGLTDRQISAALKVLVREKQIYRIGDGVCSLSEVSYPPAEIMKEYFTRKNHEPIGYLRDTSFLYAAGYCCAKPDTFKAASKRVVYRYSNGRINERKNTVNRTVKYRIRGCPVDSLNSRNILFLPVLDILSSQRKISSELSSFLSYYLKRYSITEEEMRPYLRYYSSYTEKHLNELMEVINNEKNE